jgi:hypothetical protein
LDRAGFGWATSQNFRKTTATLLDEAGLSTRLIADQYGRARPSMTQDARPVDSRAVEALEMALGGADEPISDAGAVAQESGNSEYGGPPGRRTATLQVCDLQVCDLHVCAP